LPNFDHAAVRQLKLLQHKKVCFGAVESLNEPHEPGWRIRKLSL